LPRSQLAWGFVGLMRCAGWRAKAGVAGITLDEAAWDCESESAAIGIGLQTQHQDAQRF